MNNSKLSFKLNDRWSFKFEAFGAPFTFPLNELKAPLVRLLPLATAFAGAAVPFPLTWLMDWKVPSKIVS